MRSLLVILFVCFFSGIVNGLSGYFQGYETRNNLRSRRNPSWYRTEDVDDSKIEQQCDNWIWRMGIKYGFIGETQNGRVCIKKVDSVRVLTWCKKGYNKFPHINLMPIAIVATRQSHISTCQIFDVIVHGVIRLDLYTKELCYVRLINAVLTCVDDDETLPENQIITLYPKLGEYTVNGETYVLVDYFICSTSMGSHCPGPAKLITVGDNDEEFDHFEYGQGVG